MIMIKETLVCFQAVQMRVQELPKACLINKLTANLIDLDVNLVTYMLKSI